MSTEDIKIDLARLSLTKSQSAPKAPDTWLNAPVEILVKIFQGLGYQELTAVRQTCRVFRAILDQPMFDEVLFRRPYSESALTQIRPALLELRQTAELSYTWSGYCMWLRIPPRLFPIRLHPALRVDSFGDFGAKVFTLPLQLHEHAIFFNEMATRPAIRRLELCGRRGKHPRYLENQNGITVGMVISSMVAKLSSRAFEPHYCGRFPLNEAATSIEWQMPRDYDGSTTSDLQLCMGLALDVRAPRF
ncbi:hypothetical protein OC861_006193 [Tilletia horrida]|nr:hypothetical protein OC861_006193 [Tilletia horrida]